MTYEPTNILKLRIRHEERRNTFTALNYQMKGHITFGEVKYKFSNRMTLYSRLYYFNAPTGTTVGALEYLWPNVMINNFWFTTMVGRNARGYRYYIMPNLRLTRTTSLWLKYEYVYAKGPEIVDDPASYLGDVTHVFKLQYDVKW